MLLLSSFIGIPDVRPHQDTMCHHQCHQAATQFSVPAFCLNLNCIACDVVVQSRAVVLASAPLVVPPGAAKRLLPLLTCWIVKKVLLQEEGFHEGITEVAG